MTSKLRIGVVDQAPIHDGKPPAQGPIDSLNLAKACESFGYSRYWIAEHHSTPGYSSPCPEILIGQIAAETRRIRVGSGGVMLTHYSPFKVAETFRMLHTFHPGRIDLGVGRAPGGDQGATMALSFPRQPVDPQAYPRQVYDMIGHLHNDLPEGHPFREVRTVPEGPEAPEVWMLGSSGGSAEVAGQLGSGFVLALFIGTHDRSPDILETYRKAFQPSPAWREPHAMVAVAAICAETEAEALRIAHTRSVWIHKALDQGVIVPLPSPDEALDQIAQMSDAQRTRYQKVLDNTVIGTPQQCREQIEQIAADYAVDEVLAVAVTYHYQDRLNSYRLLAEAFELGSSDVEEPRSAAAGG